MRMRHLLIVLVPFVAEFGCSHSPAPRAAATAPPPPPGVTAGRFDAGNPVIVRIAGRSKTLTIASTAHGPVYSVSALDGQTLLSQGTLDDLRRLHPDLYRHVRSAIVSAHEAGDDGRPIADPEEANDYLLLADRR
jgi:hypothetical protein